MIDGYIEELMWLEIDETISPDDRKKLHAYLESHGEAREHFDEIRQMSLLFCQADEIEPPSELRQRILKSLDTATPPKTESPGIGEWFRGFFAHRPVWKPVTAGAIGVLIGVIGYHIIAYSINPAEPLDITQFYGTMNFDRVDQNEPALRIDVPGVSGAVSVHRDESRVWSELSVTSENEIDIVLEYEGPATGFAGGELSDHPSNQVTIEDRKVRVRNRGAGTYHLLFKLHDDPTSPVMVTILSKGNVLLEEEVHPRKSSK